MSYEVELKFRIPPQRLAAVRRAVHTASAQPLMLAARYVDTAGQHLARAHTALRLRLEGERWVQTLKAAGDSPLQRHEHEVMLPAGAPPLLDLARHDGSAAGQALRRLLSQAHDARLVERYGTQVQRTRRLLRSGGAVIELALDEGEILADGGTRRLPLLELELELKQGEPAVLLAQAARWVQRFGLVLDVRSKSERGHLLAAGLALSPPALPRPLALRRDATLAQALAAMLGNALAPVLANASLMAEGRFEPEHLHQLRVGLRRLRSLLKLWGGLAPGWSADWPAQLAVLFSALAEARDRDVAAQTLWPALQAAGAPWVAWPLSGQGGDAAAVGGASGGAQSGDAAHAGRTAMPLDQRLCAPALQQLWLALLGASLGTEALPPADAPAANADADAAANPTAVGDALRRPLHRLWRQVRRDARRFDQLDDDARHRLRRRIKRLRDGLELAGSLWPARRVQRCLKQLARAQQPLGEFNDTVVALGHYRAWAATVPPAWFAVGWLSARRAALLPGCCQAMHRLARAEPAWRKR